MERGMPKISLGHPWDTTSGKHLVAACLHVSCKRLRDETTTGIITHRPRVVMHTLLNNCTSGSSSPGGPLAMFLSWLVVVGMKCSSPEHPPVMLLDCSECWSLPLRLERRTASFVLVLLVLMESSHGRQNGHALIIFCVSFFVCFLRLCCGLRVTTCLGRFLLDLEILGFGQHFHTKLNFICTKRHVCPSWPQEFHCTLRGGTHIPTASHALVDCMLHPLTEPWPHGFHQPVVHDRTRGVLCCSTAIKEDPGLLKRKTISHAIKLEFNALDRRQIGWIKSHCCRRGHFGTRGSLGSPAAGRLLWARIAEHSGGRLSWPRSGSCRSVNSSCSAGVGHFADGSKLLEGG
mmetsp:Transcript_40894/g.74050  ORF Transcript_40894/g.74050 Transcript_40894/m.74050 type:complete len:347 (+) Transcript_40894:135-1175(+)